MKYSGKFPEGLACVLQIKGVVDEGSCAKDLRRNKMESKPIDREAVLNSLVLNNSTTDGQPRKRKRLDNLSAEERALRRFVRTIVPASDV